MDETHTQFDLFGGAVSHYGMTPDIVTGGKGIGGGIPIGAYGLTSELASLVESKCADETGTVEGIALGGTLFANALSLACTEVVLTELMRPADYDRMARLGGRLADGIEAAAWDRGLGWRAHRFGARTGYCLRRTASTPTTRPGYVSRARPDLRQPRRVGCHLQRGTTPRLLPRSW